MIITEIGVGDGRPGSRLLRIISYAPEFSRLPLGSPNHLPASVTRRRFGPYYELREASFSPVTHDSVSLLNAKGTELGE